MVGADADVLARSEAVLAKLRFAVSIAGTVEDALRVIPELRPDLVVATDADGPRIRLETPQHVPVVRMEGEDDGNHELLVEEIRRALRLHLVR